MNTICKLKRISENIFVYKILSNLTIKSKSIFKKITHIPSFFLVKFTRYILINSARMKSEAETKANNETITRTFSTQTEIIENSHSHIRKKPIFTHAHKYTYTQNAHILNT